MDSASQQTVERKFDIAFFIAKENMAICELEERHGVDLGTPYKNKQACATFVEYIAKEQQQVLARALSAAKFYSFQCDGTTYCENAEDELILAAYFDGHADDKKVHLRNPFFTSSSLLAVMQKASFKASNRECITWVWGITGPKS